MGKICLDGEISGGAKNNKIVDGRKNESKRKEGGVNCKKNGGKDIEHFISEKRKTSTSKKILLKIICALHYLHFLKEC